MIIRVAYRRGRSSEQILLFADDTIVRALDQGLVVCATFHDLRKAFDSLDHVILLNEEASTARVLWPVLVLELSQ